MRRILQSIALFFSLMGAGASFAGNEPIRLQKLDHHSRLIFRVDDGVKGKLTNRGSTFQIVFSDTRLSDFGVPYGAEAEWIKTFSKLANDQLQKLSVKEGLTEVTVEGSWKFPTGDKAFVKPEMKTYELRLQSETGWAVDFWYAKGVTVAEKQNNDKNLRKIAQVSAQKKATGDQQAFEKKAESEKSKILNIHRYCEEPWIEGFHHPIRIKPLHALIDLSKHYKDGRPDWSYDYSSWEKAKKEGAFFRVASKMRDESKFGLASKALELFLKEHPKSEYLPDMKLLQASLLNALELAPRGQEELKRIVSDHLGHPAANQAQFYLAASYLEKREWLAAQEAFTSLIRVDSASEKLWLYHLAAAESYYQLKQTELASKHYEWLIKNGPDRAIQADAAFRVGDLHLDREQFSKAVIAYSAGMRTFPKEADQIPSVYLNLGEAYFRMGDIDRAKENFQKYAKKFAWETNGWRASLRLGEIENAARAQAGRPWFMESINRYPLHASSVLARMYLLGCGDHGGFTRETARFFLESKEVQDFDSGDNFYSDRYRDYVKYLGVEVLTSFGEYEEAIRYSNGIMPQFESNSYRLKLHKFRDQIFKKLLTERLKAGETFEALTIAEKYMDQVDPSVDAVFNDIWPRLLSSANQYRLINFSQKLLEKYSDQGQNLKEGRQIASLGGGPAVTAEQLELAKKAFLKAKSRWGDELTQGFAFSAETVQMLQATPDASPYSGEAGLMAAKALDAKGKTQEALKQAIKAASLLPSDQKEWLPQVQYWLSLLYTKSGNEIAAAETLRSLRKSLAKGDESAEKRISWLPIFPGKTEVAIEEARILDGLRRYSQAAEVYEELLKDGVKDNKIYYLHAQSILQGGDKRKYSAAIGSLEKVKNSKVEDFWKGLAQKSLDDFRDFFNAKEGANGRTEHKQSKI